MSSINDNKYFQHALTATLNREETKNIRKEQQKLKLLSVNITGKK